MSASNLGIITRSFVRNRNQSRNILNRYQCHKKVSSPLATGVNKFTKWMTMEPLVNIEWMLTMSFEWIKWLHPF